MKRIFTLCIVLLLIVGCSPTKEIDTETPTDTQELEPKQDQQSYIIQTFKDYGLETPDPSTWIVKEENTRVVVIIKENTKGPGKPSIHKLIFEWNEPSQTGNLQFVMVNNQVRFGKD